jgi:hypothetical protein
MPLACWINDLLTATSPETNRFVRSNAYRSRLLGLARASTRSAMVAPIGFRMASNSAVGEIVDARELVRRCASLTRTASRTMTREMLLSRPLGMLTAERKLR